MTTIEIIINLIVIGIIYSVLTTAFSAIAIYIFLCCKTFKEETTAALKEAVKISRDDTIF